MRPLHGTCHYADLTADQIARLTEKLSAALKQPSGCWEFSGRPMHSGHKQITLGTPNSAGRGIRTKRRQPYARVRAHVFAWELAHQQSVPAGHVVMHDVCDNPPCVNPAHLKLGTQADNIHDSIHKGRFRAFGLQKLNAEQVLEIRRRVAAGALQTAVARDFGIAKNTVSGIVNRHTWGHLAPVGALSQEGR